MYRMTGTDVTKEPSAINASELSAIGVMMNNEKKPLIASNISHGIPTVHAIFLSL